MDERAVLAYLRRERDWEVRIRVRNQIARKKAYRMFGWTFLLGGMFWTAVLWAVLR